MAVLPVSRVFTKHGAVFYSGTCLQDVLLFIQARPSAFFIVQNSWQYIIMAGNHNIWNIYIDKYQHIDVKGDATAS